MIRVVVVDDEALVRSGFELLLGAAPDIEVVATADGPEAVETIRRTRPDVVLLDIRMPGRSRLDVLADLRAEPHRPIIGILTTFDTDEHIARALHEGASGFLVKDTAPADLATMVRCLAAGGIVLSPQVSRTLVAGYAGGADRDARHRVDALTERERDVLSRLPTGESNAEIGRRLHLSGATVKDHVSAILAKLAVSSRLEAALIAERARLGGDGR